MAVVVKLPRLGQGMEAGTIVRWLKAEGDTVEKGEPLYELDTDKVTQEVEADSGGVLLKIVIQDGEVEVGRTIAVIGSQGEDVSQLVASDGDGASQAPATSPPSPAPPSSNEPAEAVAEKEGEEASEDVSPTGAGAAAEPEPKAESGAEPEPQPETEAEPETQADDQAEPRSEPAPDSAKAAVPSGHLKASPLARRIAREQGVDLAGLTGTGPDGRIVAEDVERAAEAPATRAPADAAPVEFEVVELTSVRRTIARRLTEAWEAPVFQLTVTADAGELVATREEMVGRLREGEVKPTVNDVLTRLVAAALVRHPPVNALFVEGEIHRYASANVGIAVAAPSGLVVPVIRRADRSSIQEIAVARADLVARARAGKLRLSDLENGTFTISNLGMYGTDQFVAVLNPPQVAILAVGSVAERPYAGAGGLEIVPTMTMTLTCDHRAIDGSEGAEFLQTLKSLVEAPALAL